MEAITAAPDLEGLLSSLYSDEARHEAVERLVSAKQINVPLPYILNTIKFFENNDEIHMGICLAESAGLTEKSKELKIKKIDEEVHSGDYRCAAETARHYHMFELAASYFRQSGNTEKCIEMLVSAEKIPEAIEEYRKAGELYRAFELANRNGYEDLAYAIAEQGIPYIAWIHATQKRDKPNIMKFGRLAIKEQRKDDDKAKIYDSIGMHKEAKECYQRLHHEWKNMRQDPSCYAEHLGLWEEGINYRIRRQDYDEAIHLALKGLPEKAKEICLLAIEREERDGDYRNALKYARLAGMTEKAASLRMLYKLTREADD